LPHGEQFKILWGKPFTRGLLPCSPPCHSGDWQGTRMVPEVPLLPGTFCVSSPRLVPVRHMSRTIYPAPTVRQLAFGKGRQHWWIPRWVINRQSAIFNLQIRPCNRGQKRLASIVTLPSACPLPCNLLVPRGSDWLFLASRLRLPNPPSVYGHQFSASGRRTCYQKPAVVLWTSQSFRLPKQSLLTRSTLRFSAELHQVLPARLHYPLSFRRTIHRYA
jgi:hypothetical protein